MPIIFVSLNKRFINEIKKRGYIGYEMDLKEYRSDRRKYYVSPANSLCFMNGGIDKVLSEDIFPNIQGEVKNMLYKYGKDNDIYDKYLPIGSSMIIDYSEEKKLILSPTMLLPQDVSKTKNAYYSTIAILYNILENKKENIKNIDILITSLCCGYGKMDEIDSINQIIEGINDYEKYEPKIINENVIINEPNLEQQPNIYMNKDFLNEYFKI